MDLLGINHIDGDATEAVRDFARDRIRAQHFSYIALGIPSTGRIW
jgi:hypothetical protein